MKKKIDKVTTKSELTTNSIFYNFISPSKIIIYRDNFNASMTNSMSDWRRRRNRRRKR